MAFARVLPEGTPPQDLLPRGGAWPCRLAAALLPVLLAACPGPQPDGCGDAGACPEGQHCELGVCVASTDDDGGTEPPDCEGDDVFGRYPNLLADPGFECSPASKAWRTQDGALAPETEVVRRGGRALRLTPPAEGPNPVKAPSLWSNTEVQVSEPGTYCFAVWMRGRAEAVRITVRRTGADPKDFELPGFPKPDAWVRIPTASYAKGALEVPASKGDTLLVRLSLPDASGGESVAFDDAVLWRAPAGDCRK
jgi:hypothetical protein